MKKLKVLYCDDQRKFIDKFIERHGNNFDIQTISNIGDVYHTLRELKQLPDILLLDLYHPRESPNQKELEATANEHLEMFKNNMVDVANYINAAYHPVGIDVAREIREHYPASKLPILIYTQFGFLFLNDDKMRDIYQLHADFLAKDNERILPVTEEIQIRHAIKTCTCKRSIPRDVILTLIGAIIGAVIPHLINFFKLFG